NGGMSLKLREIKRLLDEMPATSSVAVTSPRHLVRELFTHRGQGTLIQRGVRISERKDLRFVDVPRLRGLLETSFERPLKPDYFERAEIDRIYLANDYSAAAIVTRHSPARYLDKFAVTPKAQGAGIGASLWNRLIAGEPQLFWRSSEANPINSWYFDRADGAMRRGGWVVYWRGLDSPEHIASCVEYAATLAPSFLEPTVHCKGALHAESIA
ncbi:MAG: hypothetical protein IID09_04920, partial [Candidatus Hydrogenedentes bacterium]|nr:hypothetical protein [Candidatus Hydrogenedentota bacterium]